MFPMYRRKSRSITKTIMPSSFSWISNKFQNWKIFSLASSWLQLRKISKVELEIFIGKWIEMWPIRDERATLDRFFGCTSRVFAAIWNRISTLERFSILQLKPQSRPRLHFESLNPHLGESQVLNPPSKEVIDHFLFLMAHWASTRFVEVTFKHCCKNLLLVATEAENQLLWEFWTPKWPRQEDEDNLIFHSLYRGPFR